MSKIFGILTAIVLALAAFVATKNKAAHEKEIVKEVEQKDLLSTAQAKLLDSQSKVAGLDVERAEVQVEGTKMVEIEAGLKKEAEDLKTQSETKSAKVASNKAKLDEIREKTSKLGNIKELASKMTETNQELEALTQEISSAEATLANYTDQSAQVEKSVASSKTALEDFGTGQSLVTLNTRIRSIYPNWGFVTLAGGNNAGVVGNSTLNVVRDGQLIAKLLVTAVESNTAAASIIPNSLAPDIILRVGDRVVRGEKVSTKPAAPAANGTAG